MGSALRFANGDDAPALTAIYAPFVQETAITFEHDIPSADTMRRRIEQTIRQHPWLVCEDEAGDVIGFAFASSLRNKMAYQWTVETTIYLASAARGGGVGRRLYGALFAVLQAQGYVWAYACLTQPHEASAGFHRAMGFEYLGSFERVGYKLGQWWDVGWWRRGLCAPPIEPAPPTPLPQVWHNKVIRDALA